MITVDEKDGCNDLMVRLPNTFTIFQFLAADGQ